MSAAFTALFAELTLDVKAPGNATLPLDSSKSSLYVMTMELGALPGMMALSNVGAALSGWPRLLVTAVDATVANSLPAKSWAERGKKNASTLALPWSRTLRLWLVLVLTRARETKHSVHRWSCHVRGTQP